MQDAFHPVGMVGGNFNIQDHTKFQTAIHLLKESLYPEVRGSFFCADNVVTWNRNLSFLRDDFFIDRLRSDSNTLVEKSTVWRTYILLYFAEAAAKVPGDFVELGCYTGHTASEVLRKIDLKALGKRYFLYDLFSWDEGDEHTPLQAHQDPDMYKKVVKRFEDFDFVTVIKGSVPESFEQAFPETIAFAHIDMNHPDPESGALRAVLPRLSPGGAVVFDDYGWFGYCKQKLALDPIAEELAQLRILELPTGQGLLLKPWND